MGSRKKLASPTGFGYFDDERLDVNDDQPRRVFLHESGELLDVTAGLAAR